MGESAADRVAGALRKRLLSGELPPGARLSQQQIATEYGVSRMPARDALQTLANEGLVDLGAATAVVRQLSIGELQELYELREAIEPMLTHLAVPNVGRAEIAQMSVLLEKMEAASSATEWLELNSAFHALIYKCASRPMMVHLTEQLRRLTDRYLYLHVGVFGDEAHLRDEHRQIFEAVSGGDANRAADLTRTHLVTSHEFILRFLLDSQLGSTRVDGPHPTAPFRTAIGAG